MARVRGGNTGLVAALVIFCCFFVISLVVAVILYTNIEEKKNEADRAKERLAESNTRVSDLEDQIVGLEVDLRKANDEVVTLTARVKTVNDQATQVSDQRDDLEQQILIEREAAVDALEERQASHEAAVEEAAALQDQVDEMQQLLADALKDADAAAQARITEQADQIRALEADKVDAERDAANWQSQYNRLLASLPEPPAPGTTSPDGEVASVFGQNESDMFITRGKRDSLVIGMTFEVYDPLPVISLSDSGEARGKATIQVYGLKDDSATCRIVRRDRGAVINPGDPIVNVAYDPNMTVKMFPYGDFDIERDGGGNDIGRIEALIQQNGAELVSVAKGDDDIPVLTPDITYVVLGEKPELPDDLNGDFDPVAIAQRQALLAANEAYFRILDEAKILRIPVLSQDRFLDLVGYFER